MEPFIDEVLRKLAGDSLVAFEMRGGKKKLYSVELIQQTVRRRFQQIKSPSVTNVQVQEVKT